jgi:hypothetical protein
VGITRQAAHQRYGVKLVKSGKCPSCAAPLWSENGIVAPCDICPVIA